MTRFWCVLEGLMGSVACSGGGVSGTGFPPDAVGVDAADPAPDALGDAGDPTPDAPGEAMERPGAAGEVAPGFDAQRCSMERCNGTDDDCDGVTDNGLSAITVHLDNDGDGFAAPNAPTIVACSVPFGFTLPRDANGDGTPDWDCDDSDIAAYPGATESCNGKDEDCDGVPDRLCLTPCAGEWPFRLRFAQGNFEARPADLDGDGYFEVIIQDHLGFAILDDRGRRIGLFPRHVRDPVSNRRVPLRRARAPALRRLPAPPVLALRAEMTHGSWPAFATNFRKTLTSLQNDHIPIHHPGAATLEVAAGGYQDISRCSVVLPRSGWRIVPWKFAMIFPPRTPTIPTP